MQQNKTSILCKYKDESLNKRYGLIHIEVNKALRMQHEGTIDIIDKTIDILKVDTHYNKNTTQTVNKKYILKKKVAWIQDNSKEGGAEKSNKFLREKGNDFGFEINLVTPNDFNITHLNNCDLLIINNFYEFEIDQMNKIYNLIYEDRKLYVKYDHDHREASRPHISQQLFAMSKLNVFISPKHKELFMNSLGSQLEENSIILPLAIDTTKYINKNSNREKNSVLVPCLRKCNSNFKNFIEKHINDKFYIIGDYDYHGSNIKKLSNQNDDGMIRLYNMCETVYHEPDTFWAGERIYFEALLCGCKVICNENVGHISWNFEINVLKEKLDNAILIFWSKIDEIIKRI